jgi:toxin ParE1/3/4
MRYEFHPEALQEYLQATTWYAERDRRISLEFVEAVEDAITRILEAPTRWRVIEEDIRRCLTHVFPYAILYTIEQEYLLIVAVMHCSRAPNYWKRRVE